VGHQAQAGRQQGCRGPGCPPHLLSAAGAVRRRGTQELCDVECGAVVSMGRVLLPARCVRQRGCRGGVFLAATGLFVSSAHCMLKVSVWGLLHPFSASPPCPQRNTPTPTPTPHTLCVYPPPRCRRGRLHQPADDDPQPTAGEQGGG
jgi:hypothetical protein